MSNDGLLIENIDRSHIHLSVQKHAKSVVAEATIWYIRFRC